VHRHSASKNARERANGAAPHPGYNAQFVAFSNVSQMSNAANNSTSVAVRSSRLWAFIHLNCTRVLFPATMSADAIGVSTTNVDFWLTPWRRVDEHLPLSHIAEVTHIRGLVWDAINVESSGGLNPLRVFGVAKPAARAFVEHVRARLNDVAPVVPQQPPRR
jgi:hypothetical protein